LTLRLVLIGKTSLMARITNLAGGATQN